MEHTKMRMDLQVYIFLGRMGVPHSYGIRYLRHSLPAFLTEGTTQPDSKMWKEIAATFNKKPANVRNCIGNAIKRGWQIKTDFWLEYYGEQEKCPSIQEFYQMAATWFKQYEFVSINTGKTFDETAVLPKTAPAEPEEAEK